MDRDKKIQNKDSGISNDVGVFDKVEANLTKNLIDNMPTINRFYQSNTISKEYPVNPNSMSQYSNNLDQRAPKLTKDKNGHQFAFSNNANFTAKGDTKKFNIRKINNKTGTSNNYKMMSDYTGDIEKDT